MFFPRQVDYEDTIPFKISHNPDSDTVLVVKGHGSEPRVEFDRQMVQFPAVLPFADGSEAEVLVSNPQPYAVEIYSLEFDKQYLEEEEVGLPVCFVHQQSLPWPLAIMVML